MITNEIFIEQLSEGFFELFEDGTFQKMEPSRLDNAEDDPNIGKFTSALGIDPLLICHQGKNIVVDPGLGWGLDHNSLYHDTSNVVTNLDIFGLRREEIDLVILTHLHFDHVAGSSFVNHSFQTVATFTNARYLVHKEEWNFALSRVHKPVNQPGANYNLDELYKLVAEKRVEFIEDDVYSPARDVTLIKSGGHTPGHMVVKFSSRGKTAYFLGDLVPTEYHLNHYSMKLVDTDPLQAKKAKTVLLKRALQEEAMLYFYHSLYKKSGRLSRDKYRKYVLLDNMK
jgi:glyoxylase-like metal-dependent hydrolase (beta-lactamase superfamily II)